MKNQCDGCNAGKPRVMLIDNKWIEHPRGGLHVMGSGKYRDLMSCQHAKYECNHEYEFMHHCGIRVCLNCGDHAGKYKCERCGWKSSELGPSALDERKEITLERIILG